MPPRPAKYAPVSSAEVEMTGPSRDGDGLDGDGDGVEEDKAPAVATVGIRHLVAPIYVPCLLVAAAKAVQVPLVPLLGRETLGLSDAQIGYALGAAGVGKVVADMCGAAIQHKLGDKRSLLVGLGLMAAATALTAAAPDYYALILSQALYGYGQGVTQLGRQSWLRVGVHSDVRGSVMALLGATTRAASVVGPLLGAALASGLSTRAGLLLAPAGCVLAAMTTAVTMASNEAATEKQGSTLGAISEVLRHHCAPLSRAATFGLLLFVSRTARDVLLPLLTLHLNHGAVVAGAVVAVSYSVDAVLGTFVAGPLMDRFGRKASAFASTAGLFLGFGAVYLALSAIDREDRTAQLAAIYASAALLGAGNGFSSGLVMTISTDLAPADNRAAFLSLFRVISDSGVILGSALVGAVANAFSLKLAALLNAGVAALTLLFVLCFLQETKPPPREKKPAPPMVEAIETPGV